MSEGVKFEAKVMVEGLRQLRESLRGTAARIEEVCLGFAEYPSLLTIPGFGPDFSSKTLGAIGDPFRFMVGDQVLKMGGLDLVANRSGKSTDTVVPVISKNGKADLRYALYQAAWIASTKNREFTIWFTNKLRAREREKGIQTKMRVKLSAKLLIIVYPVKYEAYFTGAWTLMKKKEPFDPNYLNLE